MMLEQNNNKRNTKSQVANKEYILNNPKKKPVLQYDMNGNLIREWPSVSSAKRELKIFHIDACCRGIRNHAGGFKWIYKEINN
jgi:hypothetical protein